MMVVMMMMMTTLVAVVMVMLLLLVLPRRLLPLLVVVAVCFRTSAAGTDAGAGRWMGVVVIGYSGMSRRAQSKPSTVQYSAGPLERDSPPPSG